MEPVGGLVRACERFSSAGVDGSVGVAELGDVESVACGLVDGNVACDGGDGADVDMGMTESHDESDGVVGGCVGVDEEWKFVGHEENKDRRGRKEEAERGEK